MRAVREALFWWLSTAAVKVAPPTMIVAGLREQQVHRAALHRAEEALAYVDKGIDNVEDCGPGVQWGNDEVLDMLGDVRALLLTGKLPEHDLCPTCDVVEDAPNPECASWVHPGNGPTDSARSPLLCPECRDGKCPNCIGEAMTDADEMVPCECPNHLNGDRDA